jgi:hypothetical protein
MAAALERYIGVAIQHYDGTDTGTVTDINAQWQTPAQLWINTLSTVGDCFVYFSETQGTVAFFDWTPVGGTVSMKVSTLFASTPVNLVISQDTETVLTIPSCYNLGGGQTLNTKQIGGRLRYTGGAYYTILSS